MKFLFPIVILLAQIYTSLRIWQIIPLPSIWKTVITILYNTGFISFFLFFVFALRQKDFISFEVTKILYELGTSSPFILLYLLILFGTLDIARAIHLLPSHYLLNSWIGTLSITGLMLITFISGNLHYHNKYREVLHLTTTKKIARPLKIVLLSDLHLGYHNQRKDFAQWVDLINQENSDLILIAGDIVDFNTVPLDYEHTAEEFHRLNAPVYACLGNHEYIDNIQSTEAFYQAAGIHLLKDQFTILSDYGLALIGRDDRTNKKRKSISELKQGITNDSLYTIVLDHQPFHLEEAEENHIDFQFSGHTHDGQVWPITYIIDAMYEDGHGPWQRGDTHYYVSSGLGIWGGKFRIGTNSEYTILNLN